MAVLRLMSDIHVGDDVTFRGRAYFVRGLSPMSASPRRALLEDVETGESVEAHLDELGTPESAKHFQAGLKVRSTFRTSAAVNGHR